MIDPKLDAAIIEYSNAVHTRAYVDGVEDEKARIIKLLEEHGCDCHNVYCDKLPTYAIQHLIALIKGEGENK